jgi:hypothetical protein
MSDPDFPPGGRFRDRTGDYEVVRVEGEYRIVRYDDGTEARRHVSLLRLAWDNRRFDDGRRPPAPLPPKRPVRSARALKNGDKSPDYEPTFKREETSPLVAALIRQLTVGRAGYVTHRELAVALLADPRGRRHVDRAREIGGDHNRPEVIAANIVAWFSQEITEGVSPYRREFERKKVNRRWAYRPRKMER